MSSSRNDAMPRSSRDKYSKPTDEQWEAIRAVDEHLLVSASAGTGKTHTIVTRILYQLGVPINGQTSASPIQLADIAAITFTNKAAAELNGKLREALRDVGRRADAYRIDSARIGTIHSFCTNILREFALRTGRHPRLQLVDEAESIRMRAESVRDALLAALEDGSIEGLDSVAATYEVAKLEKQIGRLLDQGDQLTKLVNGAGAQAPRERAILALAERARDLLVHRLEEAGLVDYDRIIGWTRDLIREDHTVRRTLQHRIRVLFIDEFQDVDPAQREIAYLLGEPQSWRNQTTRLVLVGDPKQSIYRFRNADVTVWREVERDFSAWKNARVVPLLMNRRSVAPILGLVDCTVGKLLDAPIDPSAGMQAFEIPYAAMTPIPEHETAERAVEILTVSADTDGKTRQANEVRAAEAPEVAARIRRLHDDHGVPWSKIAVLLCGWGGAETYEDALRSLGVPTYILRDEGFYSRLEVTDALVALDTIRDPSNNRSLFGMLRSPFVGLSDASLLHIALQSKGSAWPTLPTVRLADLAEQRRLDRGLSLIRRLESIRDRVSSAELLETLLAQSGYMAHLELLGHAGQQRIANLRKLARIARGLAEESVGDLLESVARHRATQAREGEASLYAETEEVVTITSVHCAKGLEWDVVFWCDLVRTPPNAKDELLIARDRVLMNEPEKPQPANYAALKAALEAEREAESKRLWYVAATRAKKLLVLSGIPLGVPRRLEGSPAAALRETLGELSSDSISYTSARGQSYVASIHLASTPATGDSPMEAIGDAESLTKPRTPVFVAVVRGRHSATELMAADRCGRRHWLRYVVGLKEPPVERRGSGDYSNAIRRGLVVHDVLENYEEDVELGVLLEAAIGRWDPDAPPPEAQPGVAYRRRLKTGIETILANSAYRSVLDHPEARRELAFTYARGGGEYIEGKIDLVAPGDDGYAIVDVKTSECDDDVAAKKAEQYAPQRATYSAALEAIGGRPVASFGFQFAGSGAHVGGPRSDADRQSDDRLLSNLIQLTRGGDRALTRFPAECQFCGYKDAGWCEGASISPPVVGAGESTSALI